MTEIFDLIVIGTGVAASSVAERCRAAGWRVGVVDQQPFGGTCALRGCDPKKVLVGAAESLDAIRRLRGKGIGGGEPRIDWSALQAFKRSFTDPVPAARERQFADAGIETFCGQAQFVAARTVALGSQRLEARHFVIATGAVPRRLGIAGEELLASSTDFLVLEHLPKRLVLIGGGYIAAEFSHLAARAGAEVTILEQADQLLTQFDPDLVNALLEKSARLGIQIQPGARVEAISKAGGSLEVTVASKSEKLHLTADLVVHAAGRMPDLDPLDLPAAGIEQTEHRLRLNSYLQSGSNPAVYAAGDAASVGPPLTPVASLEADVVASNLLQGNHAQANYRGVPSVVFTIPPLARVGLLEQQAREEGLQYRCLHKSTADWYSARRVGEDCAGFKVLIEKGSERILGAHLLGPGADEVINLFALAIRQQLTATQLRSAVFTYPSASSDIKYML